MYHRNGSRLLTQLMLFVIGISKEALKLSLKKDAELDPCSTLRRRKNFPVILRKTFINF